MDGMIKLDAEGVQDVANQVAHWLWNQHGDEYDYIQVRWQKDAVTLILRKEDWKPHTYGHAGALLDLLRKRDT